MHGLKIRSILNDRRQGMSYRAIAKKHGISPARAHAIVKDHGLEVDRIRLPHPPRGHRAKSLSDFTASALVAVVKVMHYSTSRLLGLMAPFIADLQRHGENPDCASMCQRTVQRVLNKAGVGRGFQNSFLYAPGTLVIHGVPITWRQRQDGPTHRAVLLCLADAYTGFAFIHAYERIKDVSLYAKVYEFEQRYQAPITQVILSTEYLASGNHDRIVATAIKKSADELRQDLYRDRTDDNQDIPIFLDVPTPRICRPAELPGIYDDVRSLNKVLSAQIDHYNRAMRPPLAGKRVPPDVAELTPAKRLWSILDKMPNKTYTSERTFKRKILFSK